MSLPAEGKIVRLYDSDDDGGDRVGCGSDGGNNEEDDDGGEGDGDFSYIS